MREPPAPSKVALFLAAAFLFVFSPTSLAQLPDLPSPSDGTEAFGFSFRFDDEAFKQVDYLQQVRFEYVVEDFSRDSASQPGSPAPVDPYGAQAHVIQLDAYIVENDTNGWTEVLSNDFYQTFGGMRRTGTLLVSAGPNARPNYITVHVDAVMKLPNGGTIEQSDEVRVQLNPYWSGYVQALRVTGTMGQFETQNFPVRVENRATYIDTYELNVTGPEGWELSIPARVVIPAESSAVVNLTVQTPRQSPYVLQDIQILTLNARSVNEPRVTYVASVIVTMQGPYLAPYWIPLAALVLAAGFLRVNRRLDGLEENRERRGVPRRVQPTPRQAVLLAELKARDPEAYKARRKQLDAIYAERVRTYRERKKEERAREREAARETRRDLKAERARRKEQKALEAKLEKARAKKDRLLRAAQAKRRKELEAKRGKLEKARAKKERKLAKVREKEEKTAAKLAAKDAKMRAKAEKAAAREARKAKKGKK